MIILGGAALLAMVYLVREHRRDKARRDAELEASLPALWERLDWWYTRDHGLPGFERAWDETIDGLYRASRDVFGEFRSLGDWDERHSRRDTERLCIATGRWLWPTDKKGSA